MGAVTAHKTKGRTQRRQRGQPSRWGQGLVEYALVLLLIAIVLIFLLTFIGAKLQNTFSRVGSGLGG
jgi:pilus assembly protein Flp/PilA